LSRFLRFLFALLFTAAALWLSFRKIDWSSLAGSFGRIRFGWVGLAVANSLLGVFLLGARWRILLRPRSDISHGAVFRMNILSQYTNIVMPARLGEVVRIYLGSKYPNLSAGYVLGTLGAEKLLDLFIFAGLWLSVPFFLRFRQAGPGVGLTVLFFAASVSVFVFIATRPGMVSRAIRFAARPAPRVYRDRVCRWADQAVEAFGPLREPRRVASILALTVVLILNQLVTNYLAFLASGLVLSFQAALLVLLALQAGAIPPSLPGKIGVYEYAVILALSAFAVPSEPALFCAVVLHLVVYVPKIVLGAVFMSGPGKLPLKKIGESVEAH
jgi:uncharacterized protein (TIRG00374 family)